MSKERLCVSDQRPYTTLSRRYLWQSRYAYNNNCRCYQSQWQWQGYWMRY